MSLLMQAYHKIVLIKGWAIIILNGVALLITDLQRTIFTTRIDFLSFYNKKRKIKLIIVFLFYYMGHVTPDM